MEIIDQRGYLFGYVNIIDALVVLLLLSVVTAGVALVTSSGTSAETTQTIVFRTDPQPEFVVDSIHEGPVPTEQVVAIRNRSVLAVGNGSSTAQGADYIVRLQIELVIQTTNSGLPEFKGERLYVGRELELDLGTTIVRGTVVEIAS